ncbi:hypothetical protein [Burkholderia ubonensis]|uniref:hypothetical protein n=1 Tax=Burkholderia ubonensis TaxID=101571 RepID=UPI000A8D717D|nr:hypothetical protein [Burkholderia ubonensis]
MEKKQDTRDEFSESTKDLIAKRSGYICAYPGCRRMTVAVSEDRKSGLTMTGVAAHITAAADGGPRYDKDMRPDERSSERNGIWTCQIHGKLIDDNPSKCSVEELHRWKAQHEQWVFDRVKSGTERLRLGVGQISFRNVGMFEGEFKIPLGRHNVLVGPNNAGKTTLCQILTSFSGGDHWRRFADRFDFSKQAASRSFIEATHWDAEGAKRVRLSPQVLLNGKNSKQARQGVHIELNGCPSTDWPRSLFASLFFEDQLYRRHHADPQDVLVKALRYLAKVLGTDESLIWDALREELFANSAFGYRFKRDGARRVKVLVPDGRNFYLPYDTLAHSEQQMAFLDVTLGLVSRKPDKDGIMYVFDTMFFQRLSEDIKADIFRHFTSLDDRLSQTFFCLTDDDDAEVLKNLQSDNWINAERIGEMTLHTFR